MGNKCECYEEREMYNPISLSLYSDIKLIGICNGTKERDECSCGGDRAKCDFYPEIREKAKQLSMKQRDKKELEFYRWWVTEHNLNTEVATAFEKYLRGNTERKI